MKRTHAVGAAVLAGLTALALAACGSDNNTPTTGGGAATTGAGSSSAATTPAGAPISGSFSGAGSSAQQQAMQAWIAAFQQQNSGLTINYDPAGSGAGRQQFLAGGVVWAGSDAAMSADELTQSQKVCGTNGGWDIPVYISPIAVAFNLPGVTSLNLAPATIAKIFTGAITTWNDPAIAADNAGVTLPSTKIATVHRSDKSGTTHNFTDYLNKTAPDVWTNAGNDAWPLNGGDSAQGNSGVAGVVTSTQGSIAYLDDSAVPQGAGVAKIKVGSEWNKPSAQGAAAVVSASPLATGRPTNDVVVNIDRTASTSGDYPLLMVSYGIACSTYTDTAKGNFVKSFLGYIVSDAGQQAGAQAAGSAPMSGALAQKAAASVAAITVG
ncbi:MAG: phosphate ABC transporter substrate-binding protein PstS [Cellulomonas sp.]|uniref:phosphate ABC transporter substrate-binding protein PstS n=1 Tax=Cellulomonas sp. 73-92 TaxID=1895740 RepID=UPI000928D4C8|nr:phosphate ABC transporter substrate-binding protein PstS [Cellulomonas sp. 73-92]MBN9375787.1 phosphate ABC transporter substrate-binding protein PstS [Cellulomonas sp.]OJV80738.1 MAG: phosphate ABC transporter substrate-binding protein PstS [Cellulomonas sp. 73-92]